MKMPHNTPDIWGAFLAWLMSVKEQAIGAALSGVMAYLRSRYNGSKFFRSLTEALMCAMFAWFVNDILEFLGANAKWAYLVSVMLGYLGTDYFGQKIRQLADRKTGGDSDEPQR